MAATELITWDEVKRLLSIEEEEREAAELMIRSATTRAKRIMGRNISLSPAVDQCRGNGGHTLLLKEYPVKSVAAIFIDPSFSFGDETKVKSSDYYLDKNLGLIELHHKRFPKEASGRCIRIEYEAGYETVPDDIKQALLETVKWNLDRILYDGIGVRNEKVDGVSKSFELRIPTNAMEVFLSYRRSNL